MLGNDQVQRVMAKGGTSAGTHRPIMVNEILEALHPLPGQVILDATLGYGGHSSALLPLISPGGRLIGLDADPLELAKTTTRLVSKAEKETKDVVVTTIHTNFANASKVLLASNNEGDGGGGGGGMVDMILADLGVSSMQLDDPSRGFSHKKDGPLDLRMDPTKGMPASEILRTWGDEEIRKVLEEYSDEPHAAILSQAMVRGRKASGPITRTKELSKRLEQELREGKGIKDRDEIQASIRRVFQALRVVVNDEFVVLETFLSSLPSCLKPGGRVAILSFHSGEDRRVKKVS